MSRRQVLQEDQASQPGMSPSERILEPEALRPLARALIDLALQVIREEQDAEEERKAA